MTFLTFYMKMGLPIEFGLRMLKTDYASLICEVIGFLISLCLKVPLYRFATLVTVTFSLVYIYQARLRNKLIIANRIATVASEIDNQLLAVPEVALSSAAFSSVVLLGSAIWLSP